MLINYTVTPRVVMKFRIFSIVFILFTAVSCTEDPAVTMLEKYEFYFDNMQGTRLQEGEQIDVDLWFYVQVNELASVDSVRIVFEPVMGGGAVSGSAVYVSSGKSCSTVWTMGNESFTQILRASAYDLSGRFVTHVDLTAYAFRENQWDGLTGSPEVNIGDMVADTVSGVTFITTFNKLYKQGARYYIWEEITDPVFSSPDTPRTIEIDRNGVIYVSTSGGNIIRSLDHGSSWQPCTKPWSDHSHYLQIYVSNDNRLWVSDAEEPIRYSDDKGATWHDAGAGMSEYRLGDIFRLTDGTLIKHGLDCCSLMISHDDGQAWTKLSTPGYSQKLFVNEDDQIFIVSDQGAGEVIYRSDDQGASFKIVHSVGVSYRSSYDNIFNRWDDFYYMAIPGFGIMKSYDLINFENFWTFSDLRTLFIDHNGVLIVKDIDYETIYYLKSSG